MKSVSVKIIVWSVLALLISLTAFVVVGNRVFTKAATDSFSQFNRVFFREAIDAYRNGGPAKLSAYLGELNHQQGIQFHLADAEGHDVISGEDRSDVLRATIEAHHPSI